MKKIAKLFGAAALVVAMSSCSITLPVNATSNEVGDKVGRASGNCYLMALCFGVDASIMTAAKNGNISKISTVDIKQRNILGLVMTYETIVTGN